MYSLIATLMLATCTSGIRVVLPTPGNGWHDANGAQAVYSMFYDNANSPLSSYFMSHGKKTWDQCAVFCSDNPKVAPPNVVHAWEHGRLANLTTEMVHHNVWTTLVDPASDDAWIGLRCLDSVATCGSGDYQWRGDSSTGTGYPRGGFTPTFDSVGTSRCVQFKADNYQFSASDDCTDNNNYCLCDLWVEKACDVTPLCQNGGTCVQNPTLLEEYTCSCVSGYGGDNCEIVLTPCSPSSLTYGANNLINPTGLAADIASRITSGLSLDLTAVDLSGSSSDVLASVDTALDTFGRTSMMSMSSMTLSRKKRQVTSVPPGSTTFIQCLPMYQTDAGRAGYLAVCLPSGQWSQPKDCQLPVGACATTLCQNGATCDGTWVATCTCIPGWTGPLCAQDIDECASTPCKNKGECTTPTFGNYTCTCLSTFTGGICETQLGSCGLQTKSEQAVNGTMMLTNTIASIIFIIVVVVLIVVFLILRDFSVARVYHMIQEISLLLATISVFTARTRTLFNSGALCDAESRPDYQPPALSDTECTMVAISLHYAYHVHFTALLLEAIHNYVLYTNVLVFRPLLHRWQVLCVCLITPLIFVVPTAIFAYKGYTTEDTCWLNFGSTNAMVEVAPFFIMSAVTVIIAEATTMREFPMNACEDTKLRTSAAANSGGSLVIALTSFSAWIVGVLSVYLTSVLFGTIVAILVPVLAGFLLMFHSLGNEKARELLRKLLCCCCKKKDVTA